MSAVESGTGKADGPVAFGPFLLERRIAVGGSAEVFLARPKQGDRPAARLVVKRLLQSERESADIRVLEREARLHQAVEHPNVVTIFGTGLVEREPFIAMEYVEGVDLYRLLSRAQAEQRRMPSGLAVHIARQVAHALDSVHRATDPEGQPLNIVHRDISPSNVYLSVNGEVKVGDFGIARASRGLAPDSVGSRGLKGKFGYLAPEQVSGEPFDHRADLFSLTVLLGEMLIGTRVFPGSGQLAVLLAIRDVNIDPLRRAASELPRGLFKVCERGLAADPNDRFATAAELAATLEPFDLPEPRARETLSEWVRWARDASRLAQRLEPRIRDSVERMRAVRLVTAPSAGRSATPPARPASVHPDSPKPLPTVRREGRQEQETIPFPLLLELLATGELGRNDEVALVPGEFQRIGDVDELARHLLPSTTATTSVLFQPGRPDYLAKLDDTPMLEVLARMRRNRETGAIFVERQASKGHRRKEIYLRQGRLLHVASSDKAELLGEYLVRRGALGRERLDQALTVLARDGGRLGDTLIAMRAVEAMDVFRAIRDQGRDRVAAICGWSEGIASFYRGTAPTNVEFPLDLDVASPMMAGVIVASQADPRAWLPSPETPIRPGTRAYAAADPAERGTAPISLQMIPELLTLGASATIGGCLGELTRKRERRGERTIGPKEASAALLVARLLGWAEF